MNILKYKKGTLFTLAAVALLLIASCGQAGFDVSLNPDDVIDMDLSALAGAEYVIKVETYVETGDYGIDLSKLIYNYTFDNKGSTAVNIEVRLSLFGDATAGSDIITPDVDFSPDDGYIDSEKTWLTAPYADTVSSEGYGWVSLIGTPTIPLTLNSSSIVKNTIEITNNSVINQILKQGGIWVDIYISPDGFSLPSSGDYLDLINQTIQVTGSKDTGYFPGAFGGL